VVWEGMTFWVGMNFWEKLRTKMNNTKNTKNTRENLRMTEGETKGK
jgi:hypothetical protein